ncbi:MAG: hypothetical protein ACJ76H_14390 [Bacteriovoracaceae bacterium]
MNKLFDKVLNFANQLAADHYKRGDTDTGTSKTGPSVSQKGSNVVDIKSRNRKDKSSEGITDFTGGSGL